MAFTITAVNLVNETGGSTKEGHTYERSYQVFYSGGYNLHSLLTTAWSGTIGGSSETILPKYYGTHPDDSSVYCSETKPTPISNDEPTADGVGTVLYVATFSPKKFNSNPDPTARNPEISWGGSDLKKTTDFDKDGNPIVNSAGDFYIPKLEFYVRGGECTITCYQTANPANTVCNFSWTTNNATWNGVTAGNAAFGKISATLQTENVGDTTIYYWAVTYPIKFKRDGWAFKVIDNGFRKKVGGVLINAHDDVGQNTQIPINLDGHGAELAVGGTPVVFPTGGYKILEETDWSTLTLPNPFA